MNIEICHLQNGNLKVAAPVETQRIILNSSEIQSSDTEQKFIKLAFVPKGYTPILPEVCGALTDAPLITDGSDVWGYMDYQVNSFLEQLALGNPIIWQKG